MNTLLIVCHPDERSFTHAVGGEVELACRNAGDSVTRHDLYAEEFDPVLSGPELKRQYSFEPLVQHHAAELRSSDHLVIVHPDWWSAPPALLKGWIDRVFRPGIAYDWVGEEFTFKHHQPLLTGRTISVFITTDRRGDDPPGALSLFWSDLSAYAGLNLVEITVFAEVRSSTIGQRRSWLAGIPAWANRLAGASSRDSHSIKDDS